MLAVARLVPRTAFAGFGDAAPACPSTFSADVCAQRNALVAKLSAFSILGASPISASAAASYVDPLLTSIMTSAQAGAKPYVIKGLIGAGVAVVLALGIGIAATRKCAKTCRR